eukprot:GHRR01004819.1.p1 GENE.GHRR01004819.1~~GHRR01004819.1.p1  ORF type:complete len:258 (+),score=53.65 GHRR01004819.1:251-1024(+)
MRLLALVAAGARGGPARVRESSDVQWQLCLPACPSQRACTVCHMLPQAYERPAAWDRVGAATAPSNRLQSRVRALHMSSNSGRMRTVSKELSWLLRHSPPPGSMDAQGYVPVDVLLAHMRTKPSRAELRHVVEVNDKKRFVWDESDGAPRIRAAQGHTVQLEAPVLQPVLDAALVPCAVHATSREAWQSIQASGVLQRMHRTHIHFATQPNLLRANTWAQVLLNLKLQEALDAGYEFSFLATMCCCVRAHCQLSSWR